jgi:hypothetical protein
MGPMLGREDVLYHEGMDAQGIADSFHGAARKAIHVYPIDLIGLQLLKKSRRGRGTVHAPRRFVINEER